MKPFLVGLSVLLVGSFISKTNLESQATQSFVVPNGTRIQVRLEATLNSKTSRQGDRFTAKVIESVLVHGKEVIPKGTTVEGRVAEVKNAGRLKGPLGNKPFLREIDFPQWSFGNNRSFPSRAG